MGDKPERPAWTMSLKGGCPYKDKDETTEIPPSIDPETLSMDNATELNPANQMMLEEKQLPSPGQQSPLPTARRLSTIPRADFQPVHQSGEKEQWEYPSQQMFYNAMKRKGHSPDETEMSTVVGMHNAVNEYTWTQLMQWENTLHPETAESVRLKKFSGDATNFTMKARFRQMLGYTLPFDRHDWIITRGDEEVHYVIDFYNANPDQPFGMFVDVRPGLDSVENVWDRLRLNVLKLKNLGQKVLTPQFEPPAQPQSQPQPDDFTRRRWGQV
eukprot:m.59370 g.59370  ORF g.59370 m.59370 type:complete len:271 (-) comp22695_c1_seq1:24-836(-)